MMNRTYLLALVLTLVGAFFNIWGEHIGENEGLGYDGAEYGYYAMHFDEILQGKSQLLSFRARRILPSFIAFGYFKALNIQAKAENVVVFFKWYNLGLLLLAALAWGSLADYFKLDASRFGLGALGLFCNHAMLKYNMYYPVLTDVSGYCFAIFMVWAFFRDKRVILALLTLFGFFIWPTLPIIGALLLIFPRKNIQPQPFKSTFNFILPSLLALCYCTMNADLFKVFHTGHGSPYFPLSLAVSIAYLIVSYSYMIDNVYYFKVKNLITDTNVSSVLVILCFSVCVYFFMGAVTSHDAKHIEATLNQSSYSLALYYAKSMVSDALKRPCEFIVAHVLYFGPLLFFAICFYKKILHQSHSFGYGFLLVIALSIFHMLMPISRQSIAEYPFVVLVTVLGSRNLKLSPAFMAFFTVYALILSKVWLLFNLVPAIAPATGWVSGFSFENYVSSTGWWMSDSMYIIQGAVVLFSLVVFFSYFNSKCGRTNAWSSSL